MPTQKTHMNRSKKQLPCEFSTQEAVCTLGLTARCIMKRQMWKNRLLHDCVTCTVFRTIILPKPALLILACIPEQGQSQGCWTQSQRHQDTSGSHASYLVGSCEFVHLQQPTVPLSVTTYHHARSRQAYITSKWWLL
mmetsp:Transcript_22227/g.43319  ORF Transcript_22227/g.43319 Transcript_22227/m.43319 type:complete len:137 (-) Transcript_22227:397-807(-)